MLPSIKVGDKVICLNCKETVLLNRETFKIDAVAEYIKCPHCEKTYDVQAYHLFGRMVD